MDGIVVIDKPAGLTSHDVVSRVRRILGVRKAGHTGTLDPMATGVLPVCVGEATKLARFLSAENKTYRATMLLGVCTDTQDIEGKITRESEITVGEDDVRRELAAMVGKIQQIPPAYSALKHKGKPLYKYARQGEFPEIAPREVKIFDISIKEVSLPYVTFEVSCSKGTYVRTLCADIGERLGCGACLSGLRRLQSGHFTDGMAVSLAGDAEELKSRVLSGMLALSGCLPDLAAIDVDEAAADKLKAGCQPDVGMIGANVPAFLAAGDMIKLVDPEGRLVAVAELKQAGGMMADLPANSQGAKIIRVFNSKNEKVDNKNKAVIN